MTNPHPPLISIIIPAYNSQANLAIAIRSVLAQSRTDFELIIIDDGSVDSTAQIASDFANRDPRIKVIRQSNQGPSCARNAGLDIASGSFIAFVDADDAIHPRFLELALSALRSSGADIYSCSVLKGAAPKWKPASPNLQVMKPAQAIERVLYQNSGMLCSAWGHLFKAGLFDGLRFPPGIIYEDLDFFYRVYERASMIAHSDARMYFYRSNPAGLLHVFSQKRLDVLAVVDRIVDHCKDSPALRLAAIDRKFAANFNMFVLCSRNSHPASSACWDVVKANRSSIIFNPKSRLKNKIGALLSYLGKKSTLAIASLIYRTA
ncbi:MAG: glycosyltransferase [Clostridium sp.]|nr:glycosyltransferase [Clostridium sp.]